MQSDAPNKTHPGVGAQNVTPSPELKDGSANGTTAPADAGKAFMEVRVFNTDPRGPGGFSQNRGLKVRALRCGCFCSREVKPDDKENSFEIGPWVVVSNGKARVEMPGQPPLAGRFGFQMQDARTNAVVCKNFTFDSLAGEAVQFDEILQPPTTLAMAKASVTVMVDDNGQPRPIHFEDLQRQPFKPRLTYRGQAFTADSLFLGIAEAPEETKKSFALSTQGAPSGVEPYKIDVEVASRADKRGVTVTLHTQFVGLSQFSLRIRSQKTQRLPEDKVNCVYQLGVPRSALLFSEGLPNIEQSGQIALFALHGDSGNFNPDAKDVSNVWLYYPSDDAGKTTISTDGDEPKCKVAQWPEIDRKNFTGTPYVVSVPDEHVNLTIVFSRPQLEKLEARGLTDSAYESSFWISMADLARDLAAGRVGGKQTLGKVSVVMKETGGNFDKDLLSIDAERNAIIDDPARHKIVDALTNADLGRSASNIEIDSNTLLNSFSPLSQDKTSPYRSMLLFIGPSLSEGRGTLCEIAGNSQKQEELVDGAGNQLVIAIEVAPVDTAFEGVGPSIYAQVGGDPRDPLYECNIRTLGLDQRFHFFVLSSNQATYPKLMKNAISKIKTEIVKAMADQLVGVGQ